MVLIVRCHCKAVPCFDDEKAPSARGVPHPGNAAEAALHALNAALDEAATEVMDLQITSGVASRKQPPSHAHALTASKACERLGTALARIANEAQRLSLGEPTEGDRGGGDGPSQKTNLDQSRVNVRLRDEILLRVSRDLLPLVIRAQRWLSQGVLAAPPPPSSSGLDLSSVANMSRSSRSPGDPRLLSPQWSPMVAGLETSSASHKHVSFSVPSPTASSPSTFPKGGGVVSPSLFGWSWLVVDGVRLWISLGG